VRERRLTKWSSEFSDCRSSEQICRQLYSTVTDSTVHMFAFAFAIDMAGEERERESF
jgi:hypothetical protein